MEDWKQIEVLDLTNVTKRNISDMPYVINNSCLIL